MERSGIRSSMGSRHSTTELAAPAAPHAWMIRDGLAACTVRPTVDGGVRSHFKVDAA